MRPRARSGGRPGRAVLVLSAALLMTTCAPAEDLDALFEVATSSPDLEARQEAAEKIDNLVQSGDYRTIVRGIGSPNLFNRAQAIVLLGRMPQPEARKALRGLLAADQRMMLPFNPVRMKPDREPSDSRILVATLIRRGGGDPEAAGTLLAGAEESQTAEALVGLCYAIGALRDPAALPFLDKASRHPDTPVVRAAVQALGQFPEPEVVEILARLSTHPLLAVRSDVLSSVATREDDATWALLKSVGESDPSPEIRMSAYQSLSRSKGADLVPYFIDCMKDASGPARDVLAQNLSRLTGVSLGSKPEAWVRWWAKNRNDARWSN